MEVKMNTIDDLKKEAQNFINQVVARDFTGARRLFDANMAKAMPEARLKETWLQLTLQVGPFQAILDCQAAEKGENFIVTVSCQFEKAPMNILVVFNQDGQIAGLNVLIASSDSPYNPPAYVHPGAFHEVEVTVGSGEWALPGTLSLPEGAGPFLGVALVHGSGPSDRDETIGPNKIFRDLGWGLASQGIAVLRYEKRTKAYAGKFSPEMLARMTVQEEVIDDALSAVRLLRQTSEIDSGRIYVLGCSLGATLAPRIGQQDPSIAGLIIMGGMTRPLEDTILDQYTYLNSLSGSMSDGQKTELEQLKAKVARVKDPNFSDQVPAKDLPLNIPPAYWFSLRGYHPAEVAASLDMRIFVLQGGRDYQVTVQGDFPAWQKALGGKRNAVLKLYPKLFHLFIPGDGPSTPQEYLVEGHVSQEVIQDITRWIKNA
jgi:dienelactone hydrolase